MKKAKAQVSQGLQVARVAGGVRRVATVDVAARERSARVERMLGLIHASNEFTVENALKDYDNVNIAIS